MKEKILYGIWGALYILCVGLGMIREPAGFGKAVLVIIAVAFFIPGAMILYDGIGAKNRKAVLRVRLISALSLGLTLLMLVVSILTAMASEAVGNAMYELLALVSAPMLCGQYWFLSMFLWACLLRATFHRGIKKQPPQGQR